MPAYGFAPALHQVSVLQGVLASASRTPHKNAIEEEGHSLSYANLRDAITAKNTSSHLDSLPVRTKAVVQCLAAVHLPDEVAGEDRIFINHPLALSDRVIVLRLLSAAVSHGAFSRDVISGVPLPLTTATGVVAALLPLWLGGTLYLFEPGSFTAIAEAISTCRVNQTWLGQEEFKALRGRTDLPQVACGFRLAVCDGLPDRDLSSILLNWLGSQRVTAQTGTDQSGALKRHPALELAGEPCLGVMFSTTGMASSLTSNPSSPEWSSIPNAV